MEQNKLTLCWPNRIDQAGITGGSWLPSLPLTNLQTQVIAKKARSTNVLLASTQFEIALDSQRPVFVLALAGHNLSATATVRLRLYEDYAKTTLLYDSGAVDAWPSFYSFEQLEWEDNNFWFGNDELDVASDFTPLSIIFADAIYLSRVALVEIDDTLNGDGFVEVGRVFISTGWQPEVNMDFGVQYGYQNSTAVEEALDNTEYFDRRRQRRTLQLQLSHLSVDEAFSKIYAMQRDLGVDKELLVAPQLEVTEQFYYQTFLARLKQPDGLSMPYLDRYTAGLFIQEKL